MPITVFVCLHSEEFYSKILYKEKPINLAEMIGQNKLHDSGTEIENEGL